ncbi:hypothetical protein [Leuconostoc rapi]|uniref:hypothetical protein n=1 Tax=Leuconostoc rapi TaxID=1406906 RepID=UPI00195C718D|nr:hypothetical protein [Leuconostoc rapi]MBM7434771.1 hypothetical protein [Leuconostoc rapi]
MNKITLYATLIAIILMFVSLVSWIVEQLTFAILSANLGLLILAVTTLWVNRNHLTH